jgi:hypothetical protein
MNAAVAFYIAHEASLQGGLARPPRATGRRRRRRRRLPALLVAGAHGTR